MRVVLAFLAGALASASLIEDLSEQLGDQRAAAVERRTLPLEAVLRPIVQAMPKSEEGLLSSAAARYALHRLFVQEKGWFVKGLQDLDPARHGANRSIITSPLAILQDQVPESAKALFNRQHGFPLRELATLAALLEDLVHRETMQRVALAFKAKKVPLIGRVSVEKVTAMLDYVMMSYILEVANLEGTALVGDNTSAYLEGELPMEDVYPSWPQTQKFIRDIQEVVAPSRKGSLSFEDITHVVEEISEHYGRWHDETDCADMKSVLFKMQGCPGRVELSRFYAASLYEERWQFSESVQYLQDLGALDDSRAQPSVIVSNYVLGASNCIGTSRFYAQCCVDPCDQLMAQLEKALAAPRAAPADVAAATAATLPAFPPALRQRLDEIAHDGLVELHGRLFAQWLHHAYPQQCPMPPAAGMLLKQELPRDFTLRTGQDYIATDKEMRKYAPSRAFTKEQDNGACKLPWIPGEELVEDLRPQGTALHGLGPFAPASMALAAALAAALGLGLALGCARARPRPAPAGPLLSTEAP